MSFEILIAKCTACADLSTLLREQGFLASAVIAHGQATKFYEEAMKAEHERIEAILSGDAMNGIYLAVDNTKAIGHGL